MIPSRNPPQSSENEAQKSIFVMGPGVQAAVSMYSANIDTLTSDDDDSDDDDLEMIGSTARSRRNRPVGFAGRKHFKSKRKDRDLEQEVYSSEKTRKDGVCKRQRNGSRQRKNGQADSVFDANKVAGDADFPSTCFVETIVIDDDSDVSVHAIAQQSNLSVKDSRFRFRKDLEEGCDLDFEQDERLQQLRMTLEAAEGAAKELPNRHTDDTEVLVLDPENQAERVQKADDRDFGPPCKATDEILLKFRISSQNTGPRSVRVLGGATFRRIRPRICQSNDLDSSCTVLMIDGDAIDEQDSPCSLSLPALSTLDLCVSEKPAIALKVRVDDNTTLPEIRIRCSDPILCIRRAVSRKLNARVENVSLLLDGQEIEDGETASDLEVESGTLIDVKYRARASDN